MSIPQFLLEGTIVVSAVVTLLTNFSVLLCFAQSAELRSHVPGIFVLNLSISNILLALINMPATFLGWPATQTPQGPTVSRCQFCRDFHHLQRDAKHGRIKRGQLAMDWGAYSPTYASCTLHLDAEQASQRSAYAAFTVLLHCGSFVLCLFVLCFAYLKVLKVARSHCKRIDVITVQSLLLLVDLHPSVKERCLAQQRKRRQRAAKKICVFIGSFVICFSPYVITRLVELLPSVCIPQHWGIATKCLVYVKASSDPFVYCLLRHQYRKVLVSVIRRVVRKDQYFLSAHSSGSMWDTTDENFPERIT